MAASMIVSLKKAPFTIERSPVRGLPSLGRTSSLKVQAGSGTKIKTDKPYGINGGLNLKDGVDASGRKQKGKGVYQFVDKYGANVDGYRNNGIGDMGGYYAGSACWGSSSRL
ncbi:photosystem II 10 kDa polypeptide, chloroplastic-like isoform X1 [Punica granatum]|uniref:Photosystem II 10 kDa polypeptide, chloroplastic n=1 Tax=Punica granatum TaxID=22663 RepID=A0A6P8EHT0_PUNGR|nr:photosystem II 10 kDa polypeptide, chloroplastic-like isoform X1 [Punica granatum]